MSYNIILGNPTSSSWSLRGWLIFAQFGLEPQITWLDLTKGGVPDQLSEVPLARTVPVLRLEDGVVLTDSLAIAEEMAALHPDRGHWPASRALRALARNLVAEMHSGFVNLRSECPMNLCQGYRNVPVSDGLQADLTRLEQLFSNALDQSGGPWLAGHYSLADVFYTPVAARILGYDLPFKAELVPLLQRLLSGPAIEQWRAFAQEFSAFPAQYQKPYPSCDFPWPEKRRL